MSRHHYKLLILLINSVTQTAEKIRPKLPAIPPIQRVFVVCGGLSIAVS